MSRQYQDPNYLSGSYTAPYPYPSASAGQAPTQHTQPVQYIQPGQPLPISRDNYSDHSSQHGIVSLVFSNIDGLMLSS